MKAGTVFNCARCGVRLWAITEGLEEFAELLAERRRETGARKRIVAIYREERDAWAVLADEEDGENVATCPAPCRHRNVLDGSQGLWATHPSDHLP